MFKPLKPPYKADVGRPISELVRVYMEQTKQALSNFILVADGIYVTPFRGLTFQSMLRLEQPIVQLCTRNAEIVPKCFK